MFIDDSNARLRRYAEDIAGQAEVCRQIASTIGDPQAAAELEQLAARLDERAEQLKSLTTGS